MHRSLVTGVIASLALVVPAGFATTAIAVGPASASAVVLGSGEPEPGDDHGHHQTGHHGPGHHSTGHHSLSDDGPRHHGGRHHGGHDDGPGHD